MSLEAETAVTSLPAGETQNVPPGPFSADDAVRACYLTMLDRGADPGGLQVHVESFKSLEALIRNMILSEEYQSLWAHTSTWSLPSFEKEISEGVSPSLVLTQGLLIAAINRSERTRLHHVEELRAARETAAREIVRLERTISELESRLTLVAEQAQKADAKSDNHIIGRITKDQMALSARLASIEAELISLEGHNLQKQSGGRR